MTNRVRVFVLERRPRWTPELKRQLAGSGLSIRSCWYATDLPAGNGADSDGVVILDLASALDESLEFLKNLSAIDGGLRVIAVGTDEHAELEWLVLDLGAVAFLHDGAGAGARLARLCARVLSKTTG